MPVQRPNHYRLQNIDVTSVTDIADLTAAVGPIQAWQFVITQLTQREARETNKRRKQYLRLMLLNAQTQHRLAKEQSNG
jgi:hypothetical protein